MKTTGLIFLMSISLFDSAQAQHSSSSIALVGGRQNGAEIARQDFIGAKSVTLGNFKVQGRLGDSAHYCNRVTSFRLPVVIKGAEPADYHNPDGNRFTPEMTRAISTAPPGSKVYIKYIRCRDPDEKEFSLMPLYYKLK